MADAGASTSTAAPPPAPGAVQLDQMSLAELDQLRQGEEARLQALAQRGAQLRQAAARLQQSARAVERVTPAQDQKEALLPLTESLYVPGRIRDPNRLLVDIGTGFFVEKSARETVQYLERKLKIVDLNSDNISKVMEATRGNLQAIQMTMQGKMLEIRARQEGVKHREAVEG